MIRLSMIAGSLLLAGVSVVAAQQISAAGATFPAPIYQKWFGEYHTAHPDVRINYQAIGSGGGIQQLTAGTVDFGASDMPLKDEQMAAMKVKPLHFPTVAGAVVLSYNVPGVTQELKFSPEAIVGIYMGSVKKWNDKLLVKDNPGVKLPADDIIPVHRSDASGTNFVFTDYLSKVSPEFKSKVGANTKVSWPVEGLNGPGNNGVSAMVKQNPGAIGYVELIYAVQNKMGYGIVKNSAGNWIKPSMESVTEAIAGAVKTMPPDFRVSITNSPGKNAYPISTLTWLLIPTHIPDAKKEAAIKDFLKWMMTTGQKDAAPDYAPLPSEIVAREEKQIAAIK